MNRNQYCIAYTYKGSSTDWHTERYNRFVQDEEGLAEFIQKCEDHPTQYAVEEVFRCSFESLAPSFVETIIYRHKQNQEFIQKRDKAKVMVARTKLNSALTIEEQQILGIIK